MISEGALRLAGGEVVPPPELAGLADGLARVLGLSEVRAFAGPLDRTSLSEFGAEVAPTDVAAICVTAGSGGERPSLPIVIEAVRAAGMEVAWSGLARNSPEDARRETPLVVVAAWRAEDVRSLLSTGTANLLFDPGARPGAALNRPVRVCVASYEVVGPTKNGGIGTAATSLAELLGAAGHDVTLLYTGWHALDDASRYRWTRHYEQRNVRFRELGDGESPEVDTPHFNQARAYQAYRWLAARDGESPFDVVHFPECQGHGYYALLARRLGLGFRDTTFVVGGHSPTRWVYEANRWVVDTAHRLVDDFLERRCVELADVVVSPSAYLLAWMDRRGWKLPERHFVQHYATSSAVTGSANGSEEHTAPRIVSMPEGPGTEAARDFGYEPESAIPAPSSRESVDDDATRGVQEVVFFGRLETRKGLEVFCDALDLLAEGSKPPDFGVCFMGSETPIQGVPAGEYIRERARRWPWRSRVESDRNQLEAVTYIRQRGRLAVMPSPVDNSPNTVLEALGLGIPFITSRGGGIPELIHPLDLERATYAPTDDRAWRIDPADPQSFVADLSAEPLANAIRMATGGGEAARPRFAVDPEANGHVHVEWHERVAAQGAGRPAAPASSDERPRVSVCLVAAGEPHMLERARLAYERQDLGDVERVVAMPSAPPGTEAASVAARLGDAGWQLIEARDGDLDAAAAAAASGDWLFLCDSSSLPHRALLATLVGAAQVTDAEIVTCAVTYPPASTDEGAGAWRGNVPLGGAAAVGLHYDCFGIGGALISRDAFERLGGFELDGPPAVRRRDLLCRATLAGTRFEVVPEPLLDYDRETADRQALDPMESLLRTVRPYQRALPEAVSDLPGLAVSLSLATPPAADSPERDVYVRGLEELVHSVVSSRSWRATGLLRSAMKRVRAWR